MVRAVGCSNAIGASGSLKHKRFVPQAGWLGHLAQHVHSSVSKEALPEEAAEFGPGDSTRGRSDTLPYFSQNVSNTGCFQSATSETRFMNVLSPRQDKVDEPLAETFRRLEGFDLMR